TRARIRPLRWLPRAWDQPPTAPPGSPARAHRPRGRSATTDRAKTGLGSCSSSNRRSGDIAYNRLSDEALGKVERESTHPMNDLIFDTPLWLLGLLVIVGAALWWSGNNRQDKTLKRVGLAVFLVGVLVGVVSSLVDTDKERAARQTRQIVSAVERRDWEGFGKLLDPRTHVMIYNNREDIVAGAKITADVIGLKSLHITGMDVEQKDTVINVDFKALRAQERPTGRP